jgi:hypothetical protein
MVAIIPPIRILNGVSIHVPAVVVPVSIHCAKHTRVLVQKAIYVTILRILSGLNRIWDIKVRQPSTPILVFLKEYFPHSRARLARRDSRKKYLKAMTQKPWPLRIA